MPNRQPMGPCTGLRRASGRTMSGLVVRNALIAVLACAVALTVAGFIAAGVWDATGELALPGLRAFWSLPRPARILVEIVIGVPMAFGAVLYFITQTLEFLWLVSWPFRKLAATVRHSA